MFIQALLLMAVGAPVAQVGVTATAPTTMKTDPATYDLGGFRLGMTEAEVEQVIRTRHMTVRSRERVVDFETKVRTVLNMQDHGTNRETGRGVLEGATLDDGQGGQIVLHLLGWPDGAHISVISYLVPRGTTLASWRGVLEAKYGAPGEVSTSAHYQAMWCGRVKDCFNTSDRFRLQAGVGPDGGTVVLTQPESTRGHVAEAVAAEAARRTKGGRPTL
ncbi:hypothetical protein [Sphingomonas sp. UYP23]